MGPSSAVQLGPSQLGQCSGGWAFQHAPTSGQYCMQLSDTPVLTPSGVLSPLNSQLRCWISCP